LNLNVVGRDILTEGELLQVTLVRPAPLVRGEERGPGGAKAFLAALPFPQEELALNVNRDRVGHNDDNEILWRAPVPALKPLSEQVPRLSTVNLKRGHDR
jgi:hypothetical protein